ncbi:MAG: hypothetical protein IJG13_18595 [Kiritimatiellae bacterium]|nr:hypothetical protein [Kiritimatiellia bacterium]
MKTQNELVLLAGLALAFASARPACADTCKIVDDVKASVKSGWKKLEKYSDKIAELREERKSLPATSSWTKLWCDTNKSDQDAKIRKQLGRVRELLLSTSAQKILEDVDDIDEDIASIEEKIREAQKDRQLADEGDKDGYTKKLDELAGKKAALQKRRREAAATVCAELKALGLNVGGKAAEECLFTANLGDIIDGVIVSKNVAVVVENLRELMLVGDVTASRRYYGMYLVLVDVQIACFEDYLAKSRGGTWRGKLERMREDAIALRDRAQEVLASSNYLPGQDAHLAQSTRQNEATLKAIDAYLKVLDSHEAVIAEKLATAQKVREVIAISYETLNLAGDFIQFAKTSQDLFNSLEQLTLPPIELFNDAAIQQEFVEITKKLKAE